MGRKWPKMAENGPKMDVTENDQKRPKMAKNGRKMAENGPKMAKKGREMGENGRHWPKMAIFSSFLPISPNFDPFLTPF